MDLNNISRLVKNKVENKDDIKYYTYFEQLFDIINQALKDVGHGGIHETAIKCAKYDNITKELIQEYNLNDVYKESDDSDESDDDEPIYRKSTNYIQHPKEKKKKLN
jgi:hypothetical protein